MAHAPEPFQNSVNNSKPSPGLPSFQASVTALATAAKSVRAASALGPWPSKDGNGLNEHQARDPFRPQLGDLQGDGGTKTVTDNV